MVLKHYVYLLMILLIPLNVLGFSSNGMDGLLESRIIYEDPMFPAIPTGENSTHFIYTLDYSKDAVLKTSISTTYKTGVPLWSPTKTVLTPIYAEKTIVEEVIDGGLELIGIEPAPEPIIDYKEEIIKEYTAVVDYTVIAIPKEVGEWHIGNESTIILVTNMTIGIGENISNNYGIQTRSNDTSLIRYLTFNVDANNSVPIKDSSFYNNKNPNTTAFTNGNSIIDEPTCFSGKCWSQNGITGANAIQWAHQEITNNGDLNLSKYPTHSFFAWINMYSNTTPATQTLLSAQNRIDYYISNGKLQCVLNNNATSYPTPINVLTNKKSLIGCIFNGTHIIAIVNDIKTSKEHTWLPMTGGVNIDIGGQGTNNKFNGTIDEVRIYNRSLSDQEVLDLYNNVSSTYYPSSSFTGAVLNMTPDGSALTDDTINVTMNKTGDVSVAVRYRKVNCTNVLLSLDFDDSRIIPTCDNINFTSPTTIVGRPQINEVTGPLNDGLGLNFTQFGTYTLISKTSGLVFPNVTNLTILQVWYRANGSCGNGVAWRLDNTSQTFVDFVNNGDVGTLMPSGSSCGTVQQLYLPTVNTWVCGGLTWNGSRPTFYNISGLDNTNNWVNENCYSNNFFNMATRIWIGGYQFSTTCNGANTTMDKIIILNETWNSSQVKDFCEKNAPANIGGYLGNWSNYSSNTTSMFSNPNASFIQAKYQIVNSNTSNTGVLYDSLFTSFNFTVGEPPVAGDTTPPTFNFSYQIPADIIGFNAIGVRTNISFNISDNVAVNESSVTFYYKTNSSVNDCSLYVNGTSYCGYLNGSLSQYNTSNVWNFLVGDNRIYPATYNFEAQLLEDQIHNSSLLTTSNSYLAVELLNVSAQKQYGFFEIMSNSTIAQRVYYCNSSYNFVSTVATNANCVLFYTIPASQPYNHTHPLYSKHQVVPFAVNITTGLLSTVKVSQKSYFMIRDNTGGVINFSFINNQSRTGAHRTSTNAGSAWTNQTYTVDAHLHQFSDNDTFWYYVCASDNSSNSNCSTYIGQDTMTLGGINPNVFITNPTENTYSGNININYTYLSSNNYQMAYSNISLLNSSGDYNLTIRANNSINMSYVWNSSLAVDGQYFIEVCVKDNIGQTSCTISENITINNTILCNPILTNTSLIFNQTISCMTNDTRNDSYYKIQYDTNYCGTIQNTTYTQYIYNVSCNYCSYNITNTTKSDYYFLESCQIDDTKDRQRNWTEYDTNYSTCYAITGLPSDYFANITWYENDTTSCDYCTPLATNTSYTSYINTTCNGDQMNQSRNLTQYDSNFCYSVTGLPSDIFLNTTFYDYTLVGPTYQNTTQTAWTNISCLSNNTMNQTSNLTQYDIYSCSLNTTFTFYRQSEYCDFCTPNMTNTSFTDWFNQGSCKIDDLQLQNRSKIQYDTNYCGEIANTTIWDYQNISCNYCSYNLTNTSKTAWINETCISTQRNQSRSWIEYDTNKSICYDVTGLPSDFYANLTYYEYQLVGPSFINTTYDWTNISCILNNTMNQTRNITQSDNYMCAANTTFIEYRQSEYCLYSNPINKIVFRNYQSNDPRNQFCFIFYMGAPELCINETILTRILLDYG